MNALLNRKTTGVPERTVRVLQFGDGNFLRAFTDWIIDIANEKNVLDAGIAIVPPRFRENAATETLRRQDGLFHVVLEGVDHGAPRRETRLVTSVQDVFSPLSDPERYLRYICSPDLRYVVSNTTEAGIRYEPDDVLSDAPVTFPGKITGLLYRRYRHFGGDMSKGLVFLCCELIEDNGTLLREYVLRHAREAGLPDGFVRWVDASCIFCDTLVDRIVPGFPKDAIGSIKDEIGYDDNAVVVGELYHLWVIGGKDAGIVKRELPLHLTGLHVEFTTSVASYREKKVRILNGSHTGMVAMGLLSGCDTVLDAFRNPDISRFIRRMVEREVIPVINENEDDLRIFADEILERFLNPYLRHNLSSIALNSLSKWETRNFPTVRDYYAATGKIAEYGLFTFAALMALYAPGSGFTPDDNPGHIAAIRQAWDGAVPEEAVFRILSSGIFINDFEREVPGFTRAAAGFVEHILRHGMAETLHNFLDRP